MMIIAVGMPLFVLAMAAIMGTPFVYYFKRDTQYELTAGLTGDKRLETWYA